MITTSTTEITTDLHALTIDTGDWTAKLAAPADIAAELAARIDAGETEAEVTSEVAAHVLWHRGATGGAEPGAFTEHLMMALAHADRDNQLRLSVVFPAYARAMYWAAHTEDGIARLQDIAGGLLVTAEETP